MLNVRFLVGLFFVVNGFSCAFNHKVSAKPQYIWQQITPHAAFPQGYNYPVFALSDGNFLALNNGGWLSKDGKHWQKTNLPGSGLNSAYQKYIQFKGAIYALGAIQGNYENFTVSSRILRTTDGNSWKTVAEESNLPQRVFYGATVFKDKIWLIGGFDGKRYYNDVWNSEDGIHWNRVPAKNEWSPRNPSIIVVFKDKIWLMGGGVIDGEKNDNPNSYKEVWNSENGINWSPVKTNSTRKWRGNPIVFDDKLWLAGANRGGSFESAVWGSEDGEIWKEFSAPWSPRGAVAVWNFNNKLYLTGEKSSHVENGEIKFVYSNDVWAMSKSE